MTSIKVKIGTFPSINFQNKLVNLFTSLESTVYVEGEFDSRRVSGKSLLGLLSLGLRQFQYICITIYGNNAENDAKYIEQTIKLL